MGMSSRRWTEVEPSQFPHEREALDFVRRRLPDSDPWLAWSNFTFIDDQGRPAEVDLLVVSPRNVFLIEIKSFPAGKLVADAGQWTWHPPDKPVRRYDSPFISADAKAKRLKSLLMRQPAFHHGGPKNANRLWVEPLVFLSSPDLRIELDRRLAGSVLGPDSDGDQRCDLPGLVEHLKGLDPTRGVQVNLPLAKAVSQAMEQADIRQSERYRRAGPYVFVETIDEGDTWVDKLARHTAAHVTRRLRLHVRDLSLDEEEIARRDAAVQREFRLLGQLQHPGIDAPLTMEANPRGLALVYPHDPDAVRLDHWVQGREDADVLTRIELFRSIAEAVAYAHEHNLTHRSLSPQRVWVSEPDSTSPVPKLRDWVTAGREAATLATSLPSTTGRSLHASALADLAGEVAGIYMAPELRTAPDASGRKADVFALGCLLHLLLSGTDPAAAVDELHEMLGRHGHVPLAAAMDRVPTHLATVIELATQANALDRYESVTDLLADVDEALEQMTAPPSQDLLAASAGTSIDDYEVLARIGAGASGVVLLAQRHDGAREVLKVARDADNAERLRSEHDALRRLSHPAIIRTYGLEEIQGRTVLRLEAGLVPKFDPADSRDSTRADTLAARLREDGPPTLDIAERWGTDLLEALVALEREGVDHRDIKPENLVLVERTKNKERHLALVDFSLAGASHDDIDAGTVGYLDPFLRDRPQRRWDLDAERYAAAVVLTQLVTGERPSWGDGVDPRSTDLDTPMIRTEVIDPALAGRLVPLLERALHRDPTARFDTAAELLAAWRSVFADVDETTHTGTGVSVEELELAQVTESTPLAELGLPPRLAGAVERLGVADAGSLARVPQVDVGRIAGVGAGARKELRRLVSRLREHGLADDPEDLTELRPDEVDRASVDRLAARLAPDSNLPDDELTALRRYLGLEHAAGTATRWPTLTGTARTCDLEPEQLAGILTRARRRWADRRPELVVVRDELADWLAHRGGVATGAEAASVLLTRRGSSTADPVLRRRRARAVVRGAVEAESTRDEVRVRTRRVGGQLLLALAVSWELEGRGTVDHVADALIDAAVQLGEAADDLVAEEPVVGPHIVADRLGDLDLGAAELTIDRGRRLTLAAAAAERARLSSRGELYRDDLPPATAIAACRLVLLDRWGLGVDQLRSRVAARFPALDPLPSRPALDQLLDEAEAGLTWDAETERFVIADVGSPLSMTGLTSAWSSWSDPTHAGVISDELDRGLERLQDEGGFLVASVDPGRISDAATRLTDRLDADRVDLDALLVGAMREKASEAGAEWPALLDADDAERTDARFRALLRLVDRAVPVLEQQLREHGPAAVATGLGLLVRYGKMDVLDRLRDQLTHVDQEPEGRLRNLVLVVPGSRGVDKPEIDGVAIPVHGAQAVQVPRIWLDRVA